MNFIKKHKAKSITVVLIVAVLAIAFFCGGNPPNQKYGIDAPFKNEPVHVLKEDREASLPSALENTQEVSGEDKPSYFEDKEIHGDPKTGGNTEAAGDVPADIPSIVEPEDPEAIKNPLTCTLSIRCDTALGKVSEKADVIPKDGVILAEQTVVFYEGESVFDLLLRELKKNKIHLEFVNVPIYNSAYIEGIANLYELDCGELSGWMYKVNGWFPNYGCSRYLLKAGDSIEWVYTCDLGADVGGTYAARNGN